ncbi:hypothetical protein MKX03_036751 [Papaver bracteatum]|nr:hypothetical protein MKX03_036751 [Papaver bracteatum]
MEKGNECCFSIMAMPNLIIILITIFIIFIFRILSVIHQSKIPLHDSPPKAVSAPIILGSGGHMAKMINLIPVLQRDSREVGQSYLTSIGTTIIALVHALLLMIKIRPQAILCNGPGTCSWIRWSSIFYVESIARVKRLSLSGLLLYKLHIR